MVETFAVLEHRQKRTAPSVVANDVRLHRCAIAHLGHVAQINGDAVDGLHRKMVELLRECWGYCSSPRDIRACRFWRCRWAESGFDCSARLKHRPPKAVRVQRLRVDIHHDLPRLAAVRQRETGALRVGELRPQKIVGRYRRSDLRSTYRSTGPAAGWAPTPRCTGSRRANESRSAARPEAIATAPSPAPPPPPLWRPVERTA